MSSEMPQGWSQTTLGSLSVVKARIGWRGLAAKEYTDAGPFLIAGKHIHVGEIDWNSCDHISDERYDESPEIMLRVGDVIFSKDGSIGNPALIRTLPGRATINGTMMMLRPDPGQIDSEFLFQFVTGPTFARMIAEKTSGSSIPHIFQRDIIHFPTMLPPLDEQRRIATVLRSVDDQAGLTRKTLEATKATKNAALIATVYANSWPDVRVADLLADKHAPMRSGPFGSALLKSELTETGIPLLGIDNVHAERFVPVYRRFISEAKYRELARYTVFPNDVMVTIMGTVGRSCVVPQGVGRAISSKHVWTLTLDNARYSPTLLAWLINHEPRVLEQLRGSAQGGVMSAISSETLRNLRVPQPPHAQMLGLEQLIISANSAISLLEAELASLTRLKQLMSSDLLSGHVRVPALAAATSIARAVQPAFKRAVFAAEVVHQLHQDDRFGSVKHEKIVHLCELHLRLQDDLDRHAYKEAAGPYDPSARRSVERIFRQQRWFDPTKQDKRIVYRPLEASGGHVRYFERYFGDRKAEIQNIIDLLRPLTTQQCEIIATLYAVWNDFLIDGRRPDDDEIVDGVLNNWTDSKRQIPKEKWRAALPWLRQKGLVPAGHGEKTRVAST